MRGQIINRIYTKKEKESQILRMGGGCWTINLSEIGTSRDLIDTIVYETEADSYTISIDDAFRYGFIRDMQGEQKLCVPLKHWRSGLVPPPKTSKDLELPSSYKQGRLFIKEAIEAITLKNKGATK